MSQSSPGTLWQTIPDNQLVRLLDRSHTLNGAVLVGLDGLTIEIQARAMNVEEDGLPWRKAVKISGMAKGAVGEALDRISGAFRATGIPDPKVEVLINLTPPDVPKDGTWLDLPLAIIMLQAAGYLPDLPDHKEGDYIVVGELGLHGEVRRVPGVLSLACMAKAGQKLIMPTGNEKEAALIMAKPGHEGCGVFPVSLLSEVTDFFAGRRTLENALKQRIVFESVVERAVDFGKIRGQETAKEAALLAAAGGHNLLLIGPPGEGKSLLASAMPGILPRLNDAEKVQLTRIYSASGALEKDGQAVTRRPMRSIHHTASKQSIVGGGSGVPRPGEITMGLYGARAASGFKKGDAALFEDADRDRGGLTRDGTHVHSSGKPEIKDAPMPRKIRDLVRDLVKAGFEERRGKGSHRNYSHPLFAEVVTISGKDGSEDVNQWRKATVDVMSTISLRELADDPAAMLDRVEAGEHILVVREGRPVAELRPVAVPHGATRPFGLAAGTFTVPDDFDSPLPSAILREFEGR